MKIKNPACVNKLLPKTTEHVLTLTMRNETSKPLLFFALTCHNILLCPGRPASVLFYHTIAYSAGYASPPQMAGRHFRCLCILPTQSSVTHQDLRIPWTTHPHFALFEKLRDLLSEKILPDHSKLPTNTRE